MNDGSWVKVYRFGQYVVMLSRAPFYFSMGWLPTLRWQSLAWHRYEFKVIKLHSHSQPFTEE